MASKSRLVSGVPGETGTFPSIGLLLLRLGIGSSMALAHGLPKLTRLLSDGAVKFPDPFGVGARTSLALAVFGELICGVLIVLGAATRFAVLPFAFTMLVAILYAHADDPWTKKEHAFLFLVPALTLFFTGPGRFSIDGRRRRP